VGDDFEEMTTADVRFEEMRAEKMEAKELGGEGVGRRRLGMHLDSVSKVRQGKQRIAL